MMTVSTALALESFLHVKNITPRVMHNEEFLPIANVSNWIMLPPCPFPKHMHVMHQAH